LIAIAQGSRALGVSVAVSRRRVVALALAALVVAVLGVVYVHQHRFDGGPLSDPSFGGIGVSVRVGRAVSFTEILLNNTGSKTITIERIVPRGLRPGTRVRMWSVPGGQLHEEGGPFPPIGLSRRQLRPVAGLAVEGHAHDIHLIAEILPTRLGCVGFEGLDIDYRAGLRHYRRQARTLFFHGATAGRSVCPR
jgi:hypothetical protein